MEFLYTLLCLILVIALSNTVFNTDKEEFAIWLADNYKLDKETNSYHYLYKEGDKQAVIHHDTYTRTELYILFKLQKID